MVGWHHWLNGHGFGWTAEVGHGQGGLACCGSWGCNELDMTEWLNWTEVLENFNSDIYGLSRLEFCPWLFISSSTQGHHNALSINTWLKCLPKSQVLVLHINTFFSWCKVTSTTSLYQHNVKSKRFREKKSTSASLTIVKPSTMCTTRNCGKFFKSWEY